VAADPRQRSPQSIEKELEDTRERLAVTIDQLVYRANPKTIVKRQIASIRGYFVDAQGNPRADNILKVAGGVAGFVGFVIVIRRVTR
jgi:hypothetical protein